MLESIAYQCVDVLIIEEDTNIQIQNLNDGVVNLLITNFLIDIKNNSYVSCVLETTVMGCISLQDLQFRLGRTI